VHRDIDQQQQPRDGRVEMPAHDRQHALAAVDAADARGRIHGYDEKRQHQQDHPEQVVAKPGARKNQCGDCAGAHRAGGYHGRGANEPDENFRNHVHLFDSTDCMSTTRQGVRRILQPAGSPCPAVA